MRFKGYKIRIYPTKEQEEMIWRHIGACRFIWNYMLNLQIQKHQNNEKHMSTFDMCRQITILKKDEEYKWLYDISNKSLQRECALLETAYQNFFKKNYRFPKFKSKKRSKNIYPVNGERFYFTDNGVQIQKLGRVRYKSDFLFPVGREHKYQNVYITFVNGKFILSFSVECETKALKNKKGYMGIDLGIKELAVVSFDQNKIVFHNINKTRKMKSIEKQIKYYNKRISKKYKKQKELTGQFKTTKNIEKQIYKLRQKHEKATNIRINYIHQVTHNLVSLKPERIVMEDLNVQDMMKNKHLSKALAEQNLFRFKKFMSYKCAVAEIELVFANRFFPSSKTCSNCGAINTRLKLSDRIFKCEKCGFQIDRDYNAAINLMKYKV